MLRCGSIALLLLLPALPAFARVHKSDAWANSQFENAENMRDALNERSAEQRTRREYQKVINAYRRVYFAAPSSGKADPSVVASAQLLMEMGRQFNDAGLMRSAIRQYEFLRREYPGSKERVDALLTIGEIYKDDLNDTARANEIFEEFLRRYSHSPLAAEARANLEQPVQPAAMKSKEKSATKSAASDASSPDSAEDNPDNTDEDASARQKPSKDQSSPENNVKTAGTISSHAKTGKSSRVTGVEHWSLPGYTRVAINLDQDTEYKSQHISHPDRVFFDLLNSRLNSTLLRKTFDINGCILKAIRVAQYKPGQTRIVLEVEEHSDYHAYLVSDPARLMIEVRSKQAAGNHNLKEPTAIANHEDGMSTTDQSLKTGPLANNTSQSAPQLTKIASGAAPKKVIIEADDSDDDEIASNKPDATELVLPNKSLSTPASLGSQKTKGTVKKAGLSGRRNT